ncbi:hypothetical protein M9978_22750, partial [Sphingomonas sp. MG17]
HLRFTQLADNLFRAMLLARHSSSPSSSKYHQFWTTQKGADHMRAIGPQEIRCFPELVGTIPAALVRPP